MRGHVAEDVVDGPAQQFLVPGDFEATGDVALPGPLRAGRPGRLRAFGHQGAEVDGLPLPAGVLVEPGWTDTPIWDTIAGQAKSARLAGMAARLPAGRVGTPGDVAQAVLALIGNPFIPGTVLHVDGGQQLV